MRKLFLTFLLFLTTVLGAAETLNINFQANRTYVNVNEDEAVFTISVTRSAPQVPTGVFKIYRNDIFWAETSVCILNCEASYQSVIDFLSPEVVYPMSETQNFKVIYEGDSIYPATESSVIPIIVDTLPTISLVCSPDLDGQFVFYDQTTTFGIDIINHYGEGEEAHPIQTTVEYDRNWVFVQKESEIQFTGEFFPTEYSDLDTSVNVTITVLDTVTNRQAIKVYNIIPIYYPEAFPDEFTIYDDPTTVTFSILDNDLGKELVPVLDQNLQNGYVTLFDNGTFYVDMVDGFVGQDSFVYGAKDKYGHVSEFTTVTITVMPRE